MLGNFNDCGFDEDNFVSACILNRFHGFDNSKIIFYELTHAYLRRGLTVVRALSRRGLRLYPLDQVVIEIGKVSIFSKY